MNVQDATNLSINEGEVRTIHNSAGAQLWGKLNYNTLYKGNTEQDTTTGKNLLPPVENFEVEVADVNIKYADGVYTINGTSTGSGAHSTPWMIPIVSYTIKSGDYWHYKNDFTSSQLNIQVRFTDNTTFAQTISSMDRIIDLTNYVGRTIQDMRVYFQSGYSFNGTISPMIVNNVSTSTSYEPYTGEMPSPNPDYPQKVEVVTGEQTLSISGGTITGEFNIDLGTTELCKIGNYQDYIYEGNDGWYIHKTINKVLLNGTESWSMFSGRNGTFYIAKSDIILAPSIDVTPNVIGNYYEPKPFRSLYDMTVDYGVANHNAQHWIAIRNKNYSDVNSFKTWLVSNNTTVYYVLDTPTNTKITDTTLINSLDAVQEWLTRYGYTYSVNGNLAIIIEQNSLT